MKITLTLLSAIILTTSSITGIKSQALEPLLTKPSREDLITRFKDFEIPVNKSTKKEFKRSLCAARELVLGFVSREEIKVSDQQLLTGEITNTGKLIDGLNVSQHCQMAYFVKNNKIIKILPVSTGATGYESKKGSHQTSWRVNGWRESSSYPGSYLYKPVYFYKGQAVHGMRSDSLVKTYPDSHGCVRVLRKDADYLFVNLRGKMKVKIYGDY